MPSHNLTPQQHTFIDACAGTSSLALSAVAGSGKTFSLQQGAAVVPGTGAATSFSKSTVEELGRRMPSKFAARTHHGSGLDALKRAMPRVKIDKSSNKIYEHAKQLVDDADQPWQHTLQIKSLVEAAQTAGITSDSAEGAAPGILPDTSDAWEMLADTYDITFNPFIHQAARAVLAHSTHLARTTGQVTFNEMLYLPAFFPYRMTQHKTIIVDEAQDLSPIQHLLLRKSLRPGGRIIAAGDPNQAIYAFRGAMTDSYSELARTFDAAQLPLTVSFRCPRAVVHEAQRYVPHIEAAPSAPEGDVIHHEQMSLRDIPPIVLCRNNAPLIRLALRLMVAGISAEVAGKDIGAGLVALTKRIASGRTSDQMKTADFLARLSKWAAREIERKPTKAPRVHDRVDALTALAAEHYTLGSMRKHLLKLYVNPEDQSRPPAQIHLSTIHKSKGREWPEILFLDPQLLPAKWATQEWEQQQESNLAYVGVTRAQHILHYCTSKNIH